MIDLFEHNQKAYKSAVEMLLESGKAAIIHPTGTGKSFIGFKLCEDNGDKTVCWLSPSEYIFKTQIENLKKSNASFSAKNIRFFTYAKLMIMSDLDISKINPSFIILDEFHRCGAEMWGKGVQNLLKAYSNVPILGLSATNIRYLDNQRDMADELFEGNVASEMMLGEAIVRGILNPPKYVLSVYSYQKDLEKYEKRVYSAKSKTVRDAGVRYLEALRRAIDKADGLDVIFDKHIVDRTGKYIVFCSDKEHMDEMQTHIDEWFGKIDKNPHVYSVYTEDANANKSFQAFKDDKDNSHLRLLYAIDALNEGIHVDNVSGVILLRPTISPIIFKQQIGRALSASKDKQPVIFDIVNNVENLYSISAIEEEMQVAVGYYLSLGKDKEIVNEHFKVFDEVAECKSLFERLEQTLTASWEMMYTCAKRYFKENGDLEVPRRYKTEEGYSLGAWLFTQRMVREGKQLGVLDEKRIAKLDKIGMRWESVKDISWQKYYLAAKEYYLKKGDLGIKINYVTKDGLRLGAWIANLRTYMRSGVKSNFLTDERIKLLEDIGMKWSQTDYLFERNYNAAKEYYSQYGNLSVPAKYVSNDGIKLGTWITNLRQRADSLSLEQKQLLDELGMDWSGRFSKQWEDGYRQAKAYFDAEKNLDVPYSYKTKSGFKLGDWISNQREKLKQGNLNAYRKAKLDGIGMIWEKSDPWEVRFKLAKSYFEEHGNLQIPVKYKVNGIWLNKWVNEQKQIYKGNRKIKLSEAQIERLENIGMVW